MKNYYNEFQLLLGISIYAVIDIMKMKASEGVEIKVT